MDIDLTQLQPGESGILKEFRGGQGLIMRLQSMGLRPGKKVVKVSSHFWCGPQTIEVDNIQIAVGFGMARKIIVEIEK